MHKSGIEKAVHLVGSQSELARRLAISPQAVQQWVRSGRVPSERALAIERATGGAVHRHELRPDLYPDRHDAA